MQSRINHLFAAAALSWGLMFDTIVRVVQSPHFDSIAKACFGAIVALYTTVVARNAGKTKPAPAPIPPAPDPIPETPIPPPTIDYDALAEAIARVQARDRQARFDPADRRVRELAAAERHRIDEAARDHDPGSLRVIYHDDSR
ncbi:hypothetical protein [Paludisphaera rhizosphaerae]|uniref:hypothetical protein n=1 Tax=Paludisphaera rhizosphaerae TaxID=2711216 RepID=UPI0013EB3D2F|nr:hypothetical protein [Paludisphaera rhizosphaerae]